MIIIERRDEKSVDERARVLRVVLCAYYYIEVGCESVGGWVEERGIATFKVSDGLKQVGRPHRERG